MQGWDYRLGINGVKRMQAAYNSALVAQGAFSAYWTEDLRAVGGWPDAIGEDIVLTWTLMDSRGIVQYEPCALSFTAVPENLTHFMRQRSRWARGMFKGLRRNPRPTSRGCWPSSSPASITSSRCWTSVTSSSGSRA
jgi:poly-beta-1,6-N-acetyl-D-glucosamine synthase